MALHKKPSQAELKAEVDKAIEEIDKTPVMVVEEVPEVDPPKVDPPVEVVEEVVEEVTPEPTPVVKETPEETDYKKKFVESSREAQVLHARNKQINEAIDIAAQLPEPTEEELQKEYSEWDLMSDTEKRLAKDSLISTRRFRIIHEEAQKSKQGDVWNGKVDEFVTDPKTLVSHPELEGRVEEFKLFASKPTRRGVDFDDLVNAFLFEATKTVKKSNKGAMFEQGSGGEAKPPAKTGKLSVDEGRRLMQTDYAKFKQMLREGKIEMPS